MGRYLDVRKEGSQDDIGYVGYVRAGNRAPTWNHNRTWSYIVLRTDEEKDFAFPEAKEIAEKFDAEKYLDAPRPYPTTLAQKMYGYAMPRQFSMLKEAPYVVIPVFRCKELDGTYVSRRFRQ